MRISNPLLGTAVGLLGGGLLAVSVTPPRRAGADVPTINVDAIKPGMKGYGLTVFQGTEPEKFDVEVINVLHKFRPNQDLILVKTIHPRLEKVKVVAGMSGSPIFINEGGTAKLAGAYAYGWSFGNEPVAGVTPIETMQKELNRPLSPMLMPVASPVGPAAAPKKKTAALDTDSDKSAWIGDYGTWTLEKHAEQVGKRLRPMAGNTIGTPQPVDTPLVVGGLSERSVRELTTLLQPLGLIPLQAGGAGVAPSKDAPMHYVDGGAIAVQLMSGDSAAQATGTITHVIGNKALGFGHPMMELGSTHLPTAVAKILWILSSDQRSFKIGEPVRPLGTLIQDRESCIVIDENIAAPMIPVTVDLMGDPTAPKKKWAMEVVNDKFMSPMWAAFAFGDALSVTINDRKDASWVVTAQIKVKNKGVLKVDDFGVSGGGVPGGAAFFISRIGRAVAELMNNPWENVTIERIDTQIAVEWKRDTMMLRGAELLDPVVEPGGTARVKLTLKPYFGVEKTVIASVKIDPMFAGKDVELEVMPGWMITDEGAAPENLDQLIKNLQLPTMNAKSFVVQYKHPEQGIAYNGKVAAKLPSFAVDALKPTTGTIQPEGFPTYIRHAVDVGGYADGITRVRVTVKALAK
ncbi:MAG: SpoIVB peptidase S55 domain-containing protein [Polyangiales bacterium]